MNGSEEQRAAISFANADNFCTTGKQSENKTKWTVAHCKRTHEDAGGKVQKQKIKVHSHQKKPMTFEMHKQN